ncbi:MAG: CoA transferase [Evtepia sp.]
MNPLFTIHNSNKKFLSLNFKTPEGKKILMDLLKDADVFITNVREKSLLRNGLDYETLKTWNPGLIYAHFLGYGDKGPVASNPGFDISAFWLRSGPIADWQTQGSFPFCRRMPLAIWPPAPLPGGHLNGPVRQEGDGPGHEGQYLSLRQRHLVQRHRRGPDPV